MNNNQIILLVSTLVSLVSAYSVCCVQNTVTYCNFAKFDCITMGRKRSLKIYYQNLGLGRVKNKLTQVETILQFHSPDILFIAESTIDTQTVKYLTNSHNYNIETMGGRLWAAIRKGCNYTRRKDLEVPGMPLIWLHVGNNTKYFVGGFYREFQRCGVPGSLRLQEQKVRFDQFL